MNRIVQIAFVFFLSCVMISAQHSGRVIKVIPNYVLIDRDVGLGKLNDDILIQRWTQDGVINVGKVKLLRFKDGKTGAKILEEYNDLKMQIGDAIEGYSFDEENAELLFEQFAKEEEVQKIHQVGGSYNQMISTIYLVNGTIMTGIVKEQKENEYIRIKMSNGHLVTLKPEEVLRIEQRKTNIAEQKMNEVLENYQRVYGPSGSTTKISKNRDKNFRDKKNLKMKSPSTAFACSFFLPGLGQYYNEQPVKGLLQEMIVFGGAVFYEAGYQKRSSWNYYEYNNSVELRTYGIIMIVGGWLWSIIDAPTSASRINRKLARNYNYSTLYENEHIRISLNPINQDSYVGGKLAVEF